MHFWYFKRKIKRNPWAIKRYKCTHHFHTREKCLKVRYRILDDTGFNHLLHLILYMEYRKSLSIVSGSRFAQKWREIIQIVQIKYSTIFIYSNTQHKYHWKYVWILNYNKSVYHVKKSSWSMRIVKWKKVCLRKPNLWSQLLFFNKVL